MIVQAASSGQLTTSPEFISPMRPALNFARNDPGDKVPLKSKAERELISLVAEFGLDSFLQSTRTLVVLVDPDVTPISWNRAFQPLKQTLPYATTLGEFVLASSRGDFDNFVRSAKRGHKMTEAQLDLGIESQPNRWDCHLIRLADDRFLFFGEPVFTAFDLPEKYQRLMEQFQESNSELQETRHMLEKKQIELTSIMAQVDELRNTDPLTYLTNRRAIITELQHQVIYAERYSTPLTVSMLDLDQFKHVNDTYGHATGDEVLKFIATQLHDHIRLPDLIARYGGEEFLVLLPNSTLKDASEQAARLCQMVRSTPVVSGTRIIKMTISIGIAQYRVHEEDWQKLLNRADQALYQAKNDGRDRWVILEA
jgi:diguanylate cyclase (GGDEF)-like protein